MIVAAFCLTILGCNTPVQVGATNESFAYYRRHNVHRNRVRRPRRDVRKVDDGREIPGRRPTQYRFVAVPVIDFVTRVEPVPSALDFGPWLDWSWYHTNPGRVTYVLVQQLRAVDNHKLSIFDSYVKLRKSEADGATKGR
jgi:hypothetical protein